MSRADGNIQPPSYEDAVRSEPRPTLGSGYDNAQIPHAHPPQPPVSVMPMVFEIPSCPPPEPAGTSGVQSPCAPYPQYPLTPDPNRLSYPAHTDQFSYGQPPHPFYVQTQPVQYSQPYGQHFTGQPHQPAHYTYNTVTAVPTWQGQQTAPLLPIPVVSNGRPGRQTKMCLITFCLIVCFLIIFLILFITVSTSIRS
ncbi:unnamed protein product [Lymnaea stagnalis]|uniref:Uncharacterized protein n=1 Tax=Lymnaea stagnalis TaxID=6523 RepID=A0AAV2IQF9_LYMST